MSDSNMNGPAGLVVGTAGHIDHGKTALIRALTGIDTDRLAEEKRRGISIDLGFAHLTLATGERISFIDVPGHERFIRNMLAGASGIEAVLLIVAADESVKPQTREHFDICRLLSLRRGLIILTKADLVTPEKLVQTKDDVRRLCQGSFLAGAPVLPVSAVTGEGLGELKQELAHLAGNRTQRDHQGLARLPIDRSFALKGFGTVVTGTLWSGILHAGETVQIHPTQREARIRGLQVHGQSVELAMAGQRTAVNLAGIDHSEIKRGFVLTHPQLLETSSTLDAEINWLDDSETPGKREDFLFHLGTSEVTAKLKPLDHDASFARLHLSEGVLALPGDRFVLRKPSPAQTVAGGTITDAFPPRRLSRAKTAARVTLLARTSLDGRIEMLVAESPNGRLLQNLVKVIGAPEAVLRSAVQQNPRLLLAGGTHILAHEWVRQRREKLIAWLKIFHADHPAAPGAPVAQARLGLDPSLANAVFEDFSGVRVQGDVIALANHRAQFSDLDQQALRKIEQAFRQAGYQPPLPNEVLQRANPDAKKARGLLETLIRTRRLVRISDDLIFHAETIEHLRKSLAARKGSRFSVPEFKNWTNISRKYAIPLLEYLDHQRVTRRDGDGRIVL